ncbi:1-pyrroline-5-carboxylate dehydrogenase 2 [Pseudoalteromonas holothuriae]|uniref:1-pyrroline-5-carboxylate dehydrogenase 2 n=1 Tax=Pseudoalteromonas holothuriae TaxID=2963714 RepID=A0A9W4VSK2_9GAMM|nr:MULTISPECIES: aldehyde dehydrogenase [unclassified Pseudoalteromonas]CAH9050215.1 1-pyrroline-5-carboxylate dehydrogenase 2 [Pseudoalteromonas sp. CIP111951]CAH9052459.1 1-pyrroline-5-carboxylate dehydrogenase 2 [Pseudoalteromonas sp. CIP111854]
MRSYNSYINGEEVSSGSWVYTIKASAVLTDTLQSLKLKRNLEKGKRDDGESHPDVVARCDITSDEQLDLALESAKNAFSQWSTFPIEKRLEVGTRFHQEVLDRKQEFIDVLIEEGHPRKLAEWEVSGILQSTDSDAVNLWRKQLLEECQIGSRDLKLIRRADGVVTLSPPQNAAASNSVGGLACLIAGNALVVKAPRSCSYGVMYVCREIIAPILEEVGAPRGTLNLVCGTSSKIMSRWMDSPLVNDIFFFGSSERGIKIGTEAVQKGKKPVLELAGNDVCVVWHDADLDCAAEALTECFFGSGQICMVPKCALIHPAIVERLVDKLHTLVSFIQPGLPEEKDVLLSPVLRTEEFFRFLDDAVKAGAEVITGGVRVELDGTESPTGPFLAPTLVKIQGLKDARDIECVRKETFFPLLPLIVLESEPDDVSLSRVIEFINSNEYGLRNSFWTSNEKTIEEVVQRVNNGGLLKINDSHIGFVPYLGTHGGTGLTGGPFGELNYPMLRTTHLQGVSIGHGIRPRQSVFEYVASKKDV